MKNDHSTEKQLITKTLKIRKTIIQMLAPIESHHIGCSLGIVEILTVLYFKILHVDPKKPNDPKRDIFILSKGHAGAAVYATLAERGFFSKKILAGYDRDNGTLTEHIAMLVPGVEFSTGSLGHGLPVGAGYALSLLNDNKKNKVYVLMSDGELNEGSNWEAIMFSNHHNLNNLIVIADFNGYQGYSSTKNVINLSPFFKKISSFQWNVYQVDGNNLNDLIKVLIKANTQKNGKPHFIIADTIKGKGVSCFEGKFESHYKPVDEDLKKKILLELTIK